jgi:peroxiredoxin
VVAHDEGYTEVTDEELAAEPNIVLEPWGWLEGVLRVGGRALSRESVHLYYYSGRPWVSMHYNGVRTDANGCFAWDRLVPGKVKICYMFRLGGVMVTRTRCEIIDVSPGQTTNVTIGGSGRAVTGKFVAIGYEPIWHRGQVSIDLKLPEPARPNDYNEMIFVERREWDDNWRRQTEEGRLYEKMERTQRGRSYRAKIERDGTFRVDDVPPGEYELRACLGSKIGGKVVWGARKQVPAPDCEFVVPDVNETDANEPLDLGVIKVRNEEYPGLEPAPVFEAVTFDGERTNLLAFRGKVVLLTFWRSEPSVLSHLGYAMELAGSYKANERFVALGMSLDRDVEAAKKFAKDNGFEWINCFPAPGTRAEVADDYEIWKFPMTFVIDPYGYILTIDPTPLRFKSKVEKYLANP